MSSAWPPDAVSTPTRGPFGQRAPWHTASTSVSSSMSFTSIARWRLRICENTFDSPARPPVWPVIAARVRSDLPTFSTTTGLPRSAALSSAATYFSGSRIASVNVAITLVSGSSAR